MDISSAEIGIDYTLLEEIASECFMPLCYAGNIDSIKKIEKLIQLGIEKVCINSASINHPFITQAVEKFGTSTISICVDYKYTNGKPIVYFGNGKIQSKLTVIEHLMNMKELNVGEITIQNLSLIHISEPTRRS